MLFRKLCYVVLIFCCIQKTPLFAQSLSLLTPLADDLRESSGLLFLDERLITHEDGGTPAAFLLELDTLTGETNRLVVVNNAVNRDWEGLCHDEEYIYIGDFGNNLGTRTNLGIYKIAIDEYLNNNTVDASYISFSYEDQIDFESSTSHNFDAEAFIAYGDSLYIFTKNRGDYQTNIYPISKTPGDYTIRKKGSLPVDCLISDATFNEKTKTIGLIGYYLVLPIFISIEDVTNDHFESFTFRRYELEVINGYSHQIEGIAPRNDHSFFISAEKNAVASQALYEIDLNLSNTNNSVNKTTLAYPNPTSHLLHIADQLEYYKLYNSHGRLIKQGQESTLDVHTLQQGIYNLCIKYADKYPVECMSIIKQ